MHNLPGKHLLVGAACLEGAVRRRGHLLQFEIWASFTFEDLVVTLGKLGT